MKKTIITTAMFSMAISMMAADTFTITGKIPGIKTGAKVELVSRDNNVKGKIAETTATNGSFKLTGNVPSPTLSEIRISNGDDMDKAISLMVENTGMTVTAAHIDSVAPSFYAGTQGLRQESNVTVKGGKAQTEFDEYNKAMFPYRLASKKAHYDLYWSPDSKKKDASRTRKLEQAYNKANKAEDNARKAFLKAHPTYSISGLQLLSDLQTPFSYTGAELDRIAASVRNMPDKARLARINKAIDFNRNYLRESPYQDIAMTTTDGKVQKLSQFAGKGKYVLIDFWASWCGPCRAAIPHVRELYKKYGNNIEILAVSLDNDESAWRTAMNQEKMEWKQFRADKSQSETIAKTYQVRSIPFMLLIDPQGRIVQAGHDPDAVSEHLAGKPTATKR
ncbi:MAG: AhpC/TSA family protein [Muribaculaceae bacterium]|nr:AhpC/TSA family protein [Muribaculaceae bacterium]